MTLVYVLFALFLVPWIATFLGSLLGVHVNFSCNKKKGAFLGFAAGLMVAASIWSLIIPAFGAKPNIFQIILVTFGFVLGCLMILTIDKMMPCKDPEPTGECAKLSRPMLLVLAISLHNIPEGLALGIIMSAAITSEFSIAAATAFGIGLALQNFPEGMAVVVPLKESGMALKKVKRIGFISSLAEPASAIIGFSLSILLSGLGSFTMPLLLSVAAGAMVFVVVEELLPAAQDINVMHFSTYGFLIGFWSMAVMGILGN